MACAGEAAPNGRQRPNLCEQDGCGGLYEQWGDDTGTPCILLFLLFLLFGGFVYSTFSVKLFSPGFEWRGSTKQPQPPLAQSDKADPGWHVQHRSRGSQGLQLENIKTHEWNIVRCSAVTGENVREGFDWVVQDAIKKLFLYWSKQRYLRSTGLLELFRTARYILRTSLGKYARCTG